MINEEERLTKEILDELYWDAKDGFTIHEKQLINVVFKKAQAELIKKIEEKSRIRTYHVGKPYKVREISEEDWQQIKVM